MTDPAKIPGSVLIVDKLYMCIIFPLSTENSEKDELNDVYLLMAVSLCKC